jgi:hypothetical protein
LAITTAWSSIEINCPLSPAMTQSAPPRSSERPVATRARSEADRHSPPSISSHAFRIQKICFLSKCKARKGTIFGVRSSSSQDSLNGL